MNWNTDIEACRDLLRGGSRTFYAASKVLPSKVADPAVALYAFCRQADDAVDCGGGAEAVEILYERLARIYAGAPDAHFVDRAFADIVARFAIPQALPEALIEGLAWDTEGRRYETLSELIDYAVRVAGTVGAMMTLLMQRRDLDTVGRACDLGIAMQLTNIARDVGEDARLGRVYLPRQWLQQAGVDPDEWLANPRFDERIARVVARLLAVADVFYERSVAGIADLPAVCRPGIHAARLIYAEIGREVERAGLDSVSRRAVVSSRRKVRLIVSALAATVSRGEVSLAPTRPEARILLDAVQASPGPRPEAPRRSAVDRAVWVLELFERLERRDQLARSSRFVTNA